MQSHIDPVCGMQVDPESAAGQSDYDGQIYYFCSQSCKNKFDEEPSHYIGGQADQ